MFWKDASGLNNLQSSSKIGISLFLILCGIGYLFGFFNIMLSYQDLDQQKGMSVRDIQIAFYGDRGETVLESSIKGSMKQYFQGGEKDFQTTMDWIEGGAKEGLFESTIKPIFDVSCSTCHSEAAAVADVVTETYDDVKQYLVQDTGKTPGRLISLSHTHILATAPVVFLLLFIFAFTSFPEWLKLAMNIVGFGAVFLDIGSWWLAKTALWIAPLVIVGGASLGVSFAALVVLSLYDMWLKKD